MSSDGRLIKVIGWNNLIPFGVMKWSWSKRWSHRWYWVWAVTVAGVVFVWDWI